MHRFFLPAILFALLILPTTGWAANWDDYFPVEAISPGMVGTMYCGFEGGEIKAYPVIMRSVLGNRGRQGDGWRAVLIEAGEQLMREQNGFANGMSGAPIYIGNQLAGAFCEHFEWTLQNVGLMRPIDQMLQLWEGEKLAYLPEQEFGLPDGEEISVDGMEFKAVYILNGDEPPEYTASLIDKGIMPMSPATAHVTTYSGVLTGSSEMQQTDDASMDEFPSYEPGNYFIDETQKDFNDLGPSKFQPGSKVASILTIGDITMCDVGCLTLVDPDNGRYLAFGHDAFGGLGQVGAPLGDCVMYNTFQELDMNFQLGEPTRVIGNIQSDSWQGIAGKLGEIPHMVKVDLNLLDNDYELEINTSFYAVDDYRLYPSVIPSAAAQAMERGFDIAGKGYVAVNYVLQTTDGDVFEFDQTYLAGNYAWAAVSDLGGLLVALAWNDFREVTLESITGEINLTELEREILIRNLRTTVEGKETEGIPKKLKPGENVDLKLRLEPRMADGFDRTFSLQVPGDFPVGKAILQIYGGDKRLPPEIDVGKKVRTKMEDAKNLIVDPIKPVAPRNLEDLMDSLKPDYRADVLVIQLVSTAEPKPEGDRPNAWITFPMDGIVTGVFAGEIEITGGGE